MPETISAARQEPAVQPHAVRTMAAYAAMRACVAGVMPASSSAGAPL